jgi:amino acid efflux transporter
MERTINLPQGVALYLGAVIGAGVLLLPGIAAARTGPSSVLAWVFDGILGVPLAATFAALAARFPNAGGVSTYVSRAFGQATGAVIGWFYFFSTVAGQVIVPLTGAYYASQLLGLRGWAVGALAELLLLISVATNAFGLRVSATAQLVVSGLVVAVLLVTAAPGLTNLGAVKWTPFFTHGIGGFGEVVLLLMFAFFGWEAISHLSAEFTNPERDIPRATLIAVAVVTILYAATAAAVISGGAFGTDAAARASIVILLGRSFGPGAAAAGAFIAALIAVGTANAFVAAASRLGYALARDGAFPQFLGRLHKTGPRRAVLAVGLLSGVGIATTQFFGLGAERLLIVPNTLATATYVVAMLAGLILLRGSARIAAAAALVLCSAVLLFAGPNLSIALGVAVAALSYRKFELAKRSRAPVDAMR